MKGICLQAYIPLRTLPSEKSEMCSQLLFGETFQIIEENNEWISLLTHKMNAKEQKQTRKRRLSQSLSRLSG